MHYEVLIIGNGAEAFQAAKSAARRGQLVALVEPSLDIHEGVAVDVLRDAAKRVTEVGSITMNAFRDEVAYLTRCRREIDHAELDGLGVDVFCGNARFLNANSVEVNETFILTADSIVLACGTKSARYNHLPVNGRSVIDAESLLNLQSLPQSILVVGAGRTGLDYAMVLATLGVEVTVIDEHSSPFELSGNLIEQTPLFEAQSMNVAIRLGDEVIGIQTRGDHEIAARLLSGKVLTAEAALICVAREGRTDNLNLEAAGVGLDEHGRVWCDTAGRSWSPTIRAIGDVVGFRPKKSLAG